MRRKARELAFKVLFEHSVGGVSLESAWNHSAGDVEEVDSDAEADVLDAEALRFALRLVDGYRDHEEHVNKTLGESVEGWTLATLAKTDLAVLRLSTYEMLFEPTPMPPLIEVSVKIAKRYGGEDSGRFVNGVLAKVFRKIESGEVEAIAKT